jgi:hypothetical protein
MKILRAALTAVATLTFIGSAFFSTFTGFRPDQLPVPQVDPPIQPLGWAFSVWGIIYLGLLASAGFGLLHRQNDADWNRARLPLMGSLVIGTPWLAVAGINAIAATVMIIAMAALAIIALRAAPARDRLWLQTPVALYAGWLTAASWVALASTAAGYGLITDSFGWAIIGLLGALTVAAAVLWLTPTAPEYALTVIWALIGVAAANGTGVPAVTGTALAGIALLAVLAIRALLRSGPVTA